MTNPPDAPGTCSEQGRGMRSFSLNSPEAEAALRVPRDPWVWAGGLPREPRWPRPPQGAWVSAEDEDGAAEAFRDWLWHVEAERIGSDP